MAAARRFVCPMPLRLAVVRAGTTFSTMPIPGEGAR